MTNPYPEGTGEHLLFAIFGELPGPEACECGMPTECSPPPERNVIGERKHTMQITRDEILAICRDAVVPQEKWSDGDTARAQMQLGELTALLVAGCEFSSRPGHRGMMLDVRVEYRGFNWFEGGFDPDDDRDMYMSQEDYYLPTRERLIQVAGSDWYC